MVPSNRRVRPKRQAHSSRVCRKSGTLLSLATSELPVKVAQIAALPEGETVGGLLAIHAAGHRDSGPLEVGLIKIEGDELRIPTLQKQLPYFSISNSARPGVSMEKCAHDAPSWELIWTASLAS